MVTLIWCSTSPYAHMWAVLRRYLVHRREGLGSQGCPCFSGFQCPICLKELEQDDSYHELPCNHRFHEDCIKPWLQKVKFNTGTFFLTYSSEFLYPSPLFIFSFVVCCHLSQTSRSITTKSCCLTSMIGKKLHRLGYFCITPFWTLPDIGDKLAPQAENSDQVLLLKNAFYGSLIRLT